MKWALSSFVILWVVFMLTTFVWGSWRHALVLLFMPFAMLLANLVAIPVCVLGGVLVAFWKAAGRKLHGITVEVI